MISRSLPFVFLALYVFSACGDLGVVPGNAGWSASLGFERNNTEALSYASITQSIVNQEWKNLGTTFTIEGWFLIKPFASDPLGRWNASIALFGEPQFIPLIVRHPGRGFTNQWAHFHIQITRTFGGMVLTSQSGCGCANEPEIDGGIQKGLLNCGYGYRLYTDSSKAIGGPRYIIPNTWTHFAVTLDGDNTDPTRTRMAHLYINGTLLVSNAWADPDNQPSSAAYNRSTCQDKPMQWFRTFGDMDSVQFGYLNNQDFNTNRVVLNNNPAWNYYGLNGMLDEVRFWRTVRTPAQIRDHYDIALTPRELEDDNLVAYYNFDSNPILETGPLAGVYFGNQKTGSNSLPRGKIVSGAADASAPYLAWQSSGATDRFLDIKTRAWVRGTLPTTPRQVVGSFQLPTVRTVPITPGNPIPILSSSFPNPLVRVLALSPLLRANIGAQQARLSNASDAVVDTGYTGPIGENLNVVMRCHDVQCSNLAGPSAAPLSSFPYRDLNISFGTGTALESTVYFHVYPDCDGLYDACGICNGDNRTCQCVVYHEFKNVRMSYVLLTFMVDFLIEKVSTTTQILDETLDKVNKLIATNTVIPAASTQTQQLMNFYNGCLTNYCQSVTRFLQLLMTTNLPMP